MRSKPISKKLQCGLLTCAIQVLSSSTAALCTSSGRSSEYKLLWRPRGQKTNVTSSSLESTALPEGGHLHAWWSASIVACCGGVVCQNSQDYDTNQPHHGGNQRWDYCSVTA
eukprot:5735636-Amphidinium_carterae.1